MRTTMQYPLSQEQAHDARESCEHGRRNIARFARSLVISQLTICCPNMIIQKTRSKHLLKNKQHLSDI